MLDEGMGRGGEEVRKMEKVPIVFLVTPGIYEFSSYYIPSLPPSLLLNLTCVT